MAKQTVEQVLDEEWLEIPLTSKAVISRLYGNGVKYKLGNSDILGVEMTDDIIVDSSISLRAIYGQATILITTEEGV